MNWKEIKVANTCTYFLHKGQSLFGKVFLEVLKFHEPGLAAVCDKSGWYHIDTEGKAIYSERYKRVFGFYDQRASIVEKNQWFHIDSYGQPLYQKKYAFTGNFQYGLCVIRNFAGHYFHIDLLGNRISHENYRYAGDFKDNYACVMLGDGKYKHIDKQGNYIYSPSFDNLGVFHKGFATAKDKDGWQHIDIHGKPIYMERYALVEPFYNGCALVENFKSQKLIIDEQGKVIHRL